MFSRPTILELLLGLEFLLSSHAYDYCKVECHIGDRWEPHLLCTDKFKLQTNTKNCIDIVSKISPTERKDILHLHNEVRNVVNYTWFSSNDPNRVAWNPGDMRQMVWDYGLENIARIWATQCRINETYGCTKVEKDKTFLFVYMNAGTLPAENAVNATFESFKQPMLNEKPLEEQVDRFQLNVQEKLQNSIVLIWAESWRLGCGKATYKHRKLGPKLRSTVVCLYGPGGLVQNEPIFIKDPYGGCHNCPAGTFCKPESTYAKLCARKDDDTDPVDIPDRSSSGARCLLLKWVAVLISASGYNKLNIS